MNDREIKIGEAAEILNVTVQTLRNWDESGRFKAMRSEGGTRYYSLQEVKRFAQELPGLGWAWAASEQPPHIPSDYYCERQDRFTSRLSMMAHDLLQPGEIPESIVSLLVQAVGEIGDNSFVHNIGSWPDLPGIFFAYDLIKKEIVLADRGQGVRTTLSRVRPDLDTDEVALKVAFTEIVSGRELEKRGNGLKVVRSVTESRSIGLLYRSGIGVVEIPRNPGTMKVYTSLENVRGTHAVITY